MAKDHSEFMRSCVGKMANDVKFFRKGSWSDAPHRPEQSSGTVLLRPDLGFYPATFGCCCWLAAVSVLSIWVQVDTVVASIQKENNSPGAAAGTSCSISF